jgi:hypothetical protein
MSTIPDNELPKKDLIDSVKTASNNPATMQDRPVWDLASNEFGLLLGVVEFDGRRSFVPINNITLFDIDPPPYVVENGQYIYYIGIHTLDEDEFTFRTTQLPPKELYERLGFSSAWISDVK